jgi:hypothetical protein
MSKPELTPIQKRRLASASEEALSWRQKLYLAQILDAPKDRLLELDTGMMAAQDRFYRLLNARGLCVGDVVRFVVDGPYKDTEVVVREIEEDGRRLATCIAEMGVSPLSTEVELVDAKRSGGTGE